MPVPTTSIEGPIKIEEESLLEKNPNMELAQLVFLLRSNVGGDKEAMQRHLQLMGEIEKNSMAPFYARTCESLGWTVDQALLERMQQTNAATLASLDAAIEDAVKNLGESEVREATLKRAEHFSRIGDFEQAKTGLRDAFEKTVGSGQRLDVVFHQIRIALFEMDFDAVVRQIDIATGLAETGADWDRRNRLKVYEAIYAMATRNFSRAATLFLETIATFTSYEVFSYGDLVFYTVVLSAVALDRTVVKTKVLDNADILSVVRDIPQLHEYVSALYNCEYAKFFVGLASITDRMRLDRYIAPLVRYYCREMRIRAYSQLLESYMSVTLHSMAASFGVTEEFLDRELARFVAAGRVNCKIDNVRGIVETTRPDARNALYQNVLKHGDELLNRVQKLSRVINL